jgi:hypothetical protein
MATVLGRFVKQPTEILDYDVSYADWFVNRSDTAASAVTSATAGITIQSSTLTGTNIRIVLSGGVAGGTYEITVLLTTSSGIVKEANFIVRVKDF